MNAFPAFVPLAGVRVVVAGDGDAADAKARLFEGGPAELVRVRDPDAALRAETYAGARLAFIALDAPAAVQAAEAARAAGAWVNVVDRPELCEFQTPSIVDRGAVVGAIGTGGQAPLLASRLRTELEARWPEGLGALAQLMVEMRPRVRVALADGRERRAALARIMKGPTAAAALAGDLQTARGLAEADLARASPATGEVTHVLAPDDPESLTLRDLRRLGRADRLVIEGEVAPAVLAHARRDAIRTGPVEQATLESWSAAGDAVVVLVGRAQPPRA